MASYLMHLAAGATVAKAAGANRGRAIYAAVLAASPDIDLLVGLLARGDSGAFHRIVWSHSPLTAAMALIAMTALFLVADAVAAGWRRLRYRRAFGLGLLAGVAVLTHPLMDFVLVNPLFIDTEGLTGRRLLTAYVANFFTDLLFYGAILLAVLASARFVRRRLVHLAVIRR